VSLRQRPLTLLAAALLSGCGNAPVAGTFHDIGQQLRANIARKTSATAKPTALTRAELRGAKGPLILATLPRFGTMAVLGVYGRNGDVITWATPKLVEISTRNGLVLATDGLPGDLTSAEPPALAEIARGTGTVSARYYVLNCLGQVSTIAASCRLATLGPETITVVGLSYRTRHITATCNTPSESFRNDYWLGPRNTIRKSRQWIGPGSGMLVLENLAQ
jgi:hypothetical protein